jgi:hypothetical protein
MERCCARDGAYESIRVPLGTANKRADSKLLEETVMANNATDEVHKLACDLIVKAYEHHKTHARFQETQRGWMVAAYFTLTGGIFGAVALRYTDKDLADLLPRMLVVHGLITLLIMVSVSKVSGEFRRHFTRAEKILRDASSACAGSLGIADVLKNATLETAAFKTKAPDKQGETATKKEERPKKSVWIVLFSNAAVHAYMFSLLSACDVYMLCSGVGSARLYPERALEVSIAWFLATAAAQHWYINRLERTGI